MLKLWSLEKTNVQGILDLYETPKPNYNTISTIVRILEKKKYRYFQQVIFHLGKVIIAKVLLKYKA